MDSGEWLAVLAVVGFFVVLGFVIWGVVRLVANHTKGKYPDARNDWNVEHNLNSIDFTGND